MNIEELVKKLPKWARSAVLSAPQNYSEVLRKINDQHLSSLAQALWELDKLGIIGFGYRCFWQNGDTAIFSLNKDWHDLIKLDGFIALNNTYIRDELISAIKNEVNIITRTRDKTNNTYLSLLNKTSVNNGILIYNHSDSRIEIFFFNCLTPNDRDLLLNKVRLIQELINLSKYVLREIIDAKEMLSMRSRCLNKKQIKICFKNKTNEKQEKKTNFTNVFVRGSVISLSRCDLECMYFLQYGSSITHIASSVGKSAATIKDRIESLKNKLNVCTKNELIDIAKQDLNFLLCDSKYNKNKPYRFSNYEK